MPSPALRLAVPLAIAASLALAAPGQADPSGSFAQVLNSARSTEGLPALSVTQALASPPARMYGAINAARARNGLPAVALSRSLTLASTRYAGTLASHHLFQHARRIRTRHAFSVVGEILARAPRCGSGIDSIVNAWLQSPVHRPILLGGEFRAVGIGTTEARYDGQRWTVWVVRFGRPF